MELEYKKLIPLLLVMVAYVNYTNYFKVDQNKLIAKIKILKVKVQKEVDIGETYKDKSSLEKLKNNFYYKKFMLDDKLKYSKAMGKLQNIISSSIDSSCKIKNIKWGTSAKTSTWYERLRMNVMMECSPKGFIVFKDNLNKTNKIYKFENFQIRRMDKDKKLSITYQFIGYKLSDLK